MKLNNSWQQSSLVGVGTIINSFLGLFFYVLVARSLGVSNFGYFSYLLGLGLIAAELGDLGFSSALVKFSSQLGFPPVFWTMAFQRLCVSLLIILIFIPLNFYSGLIAVVLLFTGLVTQSLIVKQNYSLFVGCNIFGNSLRLVLTVWLLFANFLTPISAIVVFCLGASFTTLVGFIGLLRFIFPVPHGETIRVIKVIFPFIRWVALSFGVASLSAKIDIPLIYLLAGPPAAGLYSSAQKLTSVLPQIAANLEGVFSPKFSLEENFSKHFKDYRNITIFIAVGIIFMIPLSPFLTTLIYGQKYQESIPILQVLLVSSAIFFVAGPYASSVIYRFSKSSYHLVSSILQLVFSVIFYLWLVPILGAIGAAITSVAVNVLSLFLFFGFHYRLWQKKRP